MTDEKPKDEASEEQQETETVEVIDKRAAALVKAEPGPAPMVQTTTPAGLLAIAVQQGADLAKIEKLMELQERWEARQATIAFTEAMSAFKANPPTIFKDRKVGYKDVKYCHASLGNVVATTTEALSKHGLSARWDTQQDEKVITVTCIITHVQGHSEKVTLRAGPDNSGSKNAIQAIGSTVSYLQRYTLLAALGLATEDQDDDGRTSNGGSNSNGKTEKMTPDPEESTEGLDEWTIGTLRAFKVIGIMRAEIEGPHGFDKPATEWVKEQDREGLNAIYRKFKGIPPSERPAAIKEYFEPRERVPGEEG